MKNKFIAVSKIATYLLIGAVFLSSCGGNEKSHDHSKMSSDHSHEKGGHDHKAKETATSATNISKDQAQKILASYLKIKDALVKTDGNTAATAAKELVSLLAKGEDAMINSLKADAQTIMDTEDTEKQREKFNTLSGNVYQLVKSTSPNENTIYKQYCPMAFNNTGAFWLSAEKEVYNPYFGDKMLRCGSVKEEL